jgi:hypothetical protein
VSAQRTGRIGSGDRTAIYSQMRFVFTTYLLLIAIGLAYAIAIGLVNPQ